MVQMLPRTAFFLLGIVVSIGLPLGFLIRNFRANGDGAAAH
jgi:hypothetical protein